MHTEENTCRTVDAARCSHACLSIAGDKPGVVASWRRAGEHDMDRCIEFFSRFSSAWHAWHGLVRLVPVLLLHFPADPIWPS